MACMKSTRKEVNEGNPKDVKKWATKSQPSTIIRKLVRLEDKKEMCKTGEIALELKQLYRNLYTNNHVNNIRRFEVLRTFNQKISEEEKLKMSSIFSVHEVKWNKLLINFNLIKVQALMGSLLNYTSITNSKWQDGFADFFKNSPRKKNSRILSIQLISNYSRKLIKHRMLKMLDLLVQLILTKKFWHTLWRVVSKKFYPRL